MTEKLSSALTFYFKVLLPLVWICAFGTGTIALWVGAFDQPSPPPDGMKWAFLVFWILGSTVLSWFSIKLKTVSLSGDNLKIVNFTKEVIVPLSSVNEVSESRFISPKMIFLTLYPASEFGERIAFVPKAKLYNPFGEHPIADKLRHLPHL